MYTATKRSHRRMRALERAFELSASEVASGRRTLKQHEQFVEDALAGQIELGRPPSRAGWLAAGVMGLCAAGVLVAFGYDGQSPREPTGGSAFAPAERSPQTDDSRSAASGSTSPAPEPRFSQPDKPSAGDYRSECPVRFCPTGSNAYLYIKHWRLSAKGGKMVGPRNRRRLRVRVI